MKKNLSILGAIIFLSSCSQTDLPLISETVQEDNTFKVKSIYEDSSQIEDSLFIANHYGFIHSFEEFENCYVVNGDMLFTKTDVWNAKQQPEPRMYGSVLPIAKQHIYVTIADYSTDFTTKDRVLAAINKWNAVKGCNLHFATNLDANPINHDGWPSVIISIDSSSNLFPNDCNNGVGIIVSEVIHSLPCTQMNIKTSNNNFKALDDTQKEYAIMHALGHMIGLNDAEDAQGWIGGTNNSFEDTIMYSYDYLKRFNTSWSGITRADIEDLVEIYPLKMVNPHLVVSGKVYSNAAIAAKEDYVISLSYDTIKDTTDLYVDYIISSQNNLHYTSTISNNSLLFTPSDYGTVTITAKLKKTHTSSTGYPEEIVLDQHSESFQIYDICLPQEVEIGSNFNLSWQTDFRMNITAEERFFDYDNRNISITRTSSNSFTIKVNDFGDYYFRATLDNNGNEEDIKYVHIRKLYRPNYNYIIKDTISRHISMKEVYDQCPENMRHIIISSYNEQNTVHFGVGQFIPNRLAYNLYKTYFRDAFLPPARVDRRPVSDFQNMVLCTLNQGDNSYIQLPPAENGYMNVPSPGWLYFYGRTCVMIPEDVIEII